MLEARIILVYARGLIGVIAHRALAFVLAVAPLGMSVADARHIEVKARSGLCMPLPSPLVAHVYECAFGMASAGLVFDLRRACLHVLRLGVAEPAKHRRGVPSLSAALGVQVIEHEAVRKVE